MLPAASELLAALVLLGDPFTGIPPRPPPRADQFLRGFEPATHAPCAEIVVLRVPSEPRVRIAGGHFVMGSTASEMLRAIDLCSKEPFGVRCGAPGDDVGPWIRSEGHAHEVTVSTFELDRTEVRVDAYRRCVSARACAMPTFPSADPRYDRPDLPVTHVTWEDARAYCGWVGGHLPTEAEWEFAAAGRRGSQFPWGDLYNPHLSNHGAWADDPTDGRDGFIGLAPVGSFRDGATPTGLLDMAGNAAEWVADFYDRDDEGYGYPRATQVNPKGPPSSPYGHVVRGGSFRDAAVWQRAAARRAWPLAARDIGFRCAYDVREAGSPSTPAAP